MNHRTRLHSTALTATALLALTTVAFSTGPASASRLPADPMAFVGAPAPTARFVIESQANHVWAAIEDIHSA